MVNDVIRVQAIIIKKPLFANVPNCLSHVPKVHDDVTNGKNTGINGLLFFKVPAI